MGIKGHPAIQTFFCLCANSFPEDILFSLAALQPTCSYVSFHSVHRLKHVYGKPAYLPDFVTHKFIETSGTKAQLHQRDVCCDSSKNK